VKILKYESICSFFLKARRAKGKTVASPFIIYIPSIQKNFFEQQYIYKKALQKLFILSFVTLNPPVSFGLAGFKACYEISSEV
jgi:hypothetical protein